MPTWLTLPRLPVSDGSTRTRTGAQTASENTAPTHTPEERSSHQHSPPVSATPAQAQSSKQTSQATTSIASDTSALHAGGPTTEIHLGYDLQSFGPFGRQWIEESQPQDEVFRNQQAVDRAKLDLGHPTQRLDHVHDDHFPTKVERFGLTRLSIAQRKEREPAPKSFRNPCKNGMLTASCDVCQPCLPAFVYIHPSLFCENGSSQPALLVRFRNEKGNEIKIFKCLTCLLATKSDCSFNKGAMRLRLETDGSVKIVYRPGGQVPAIVRDISETNVGIKNRSSVISSAVANEPLAKQGESSTEGSANASEVDKMVEGKVERSIPGGDASASIKLEKDAEDRGSKEKRKREVSPDDERTRRSSRARLLETDVHNAANEVPGVLTQLPTPASPSGSTSSGFFQIVDQAPASNDQPTNSARVVQTTMPAQDGSAGPSDSVIPEEKTVEELEEENEALEAEYRQRLKDKSNVLRLKLQAIARR